MPPAHGKLAPGPSLTQGGLPPLEDPNATNSTISALKKTHTSLIQAPATVFTQAAIHNFQFNSAPYQPPRRASVAGTVSQMTKQNSKEEEERNLDLADV